MAAGHGRRRYVWRICHWRTLYAVGTEPGSMDELYAMRYPMEFVRLFCSTATRRAAFVRRQRRAILAAGGHRLWGIALDVLCFAAVCDRADGRLLDHLGSPANPEHIAEVVGLSPEQLGRALRLLSGRAVGFIERAAWRPGGTPPGPDGGGIGRRGPCPADGPERGTGDDPDSGQGAGDAERGQGPGGRGPPGEESPGDAAAGAAEEQEQDQEQEQAEGARLSARGKAAAPQDEEEAAPAEQGRPGAREAEAAASGEGQRRQAEAEAARPTGADPAGQVRATEDPDTGVVELTIGEPRSGADPGGGAAGGPPPAGPALDGDAVAWTIFALLYPTERAKQIGAERGGTNGTPLSLRQFTERETAALRSGWDRLAAAHADEQVAFRLGRQRAAEIGRRRVTPHKTAGAIWCHWIRQHTAKQRATAAGGHH